MGEAEDREAEGSADHHDAAGQLLKLVEKILATKRLPGDPAGNVIESLPLSSTFENIAKHLEMNSYVQLVTRFISLCEGAKLEVELLNLKRESVRKEWVSRIEDIASVFNASNFDQRTGKVFSRHFSGVNLSALDTISERFLTDRSTQSPVRELKESLSIVRDALGEFSNKGKLSPRIERLLSIYISNLENIVNNYSDFGEDDFWEVYKKIFATFMQIHGSVVDEENKDAINEKMRNILNKLVISTSLGANAITIGGSFLPLITG